MKTAPRAKLNKQVRDRRAEARKKGLCSACCAEKPEAGRKQCRKCLDYHRELIKERTRERAALGLCTLCGEAGLEEGRKTHEACSASGRKYESYRRWQDARAERLRLLREVGICNCGRGKIARRGRCAACFDKYANRDKSKEKIGRMVIYLVATSMRVVDERRSGGRDGWLEGRWRPVGHLLRRRGGGATSGQDPAGGFPEGERRLR